jgi:hypothetical protein
MRGTTSIDRASSSGEPCGRWLATSATTASDTALVFEGAIWTGNVRKVRHLDEATAAATSG